MKAVKISCLLIILFTTIPIYSQIKNKNVSGKQFVYIIESFDGRIYSSSFAFKKNKYIYAEGSHPIIINAVNANVYFWEITNNYKMDPEGVLILEGRLRISKGKKIIFEKDRDQYALLYMKNVDRTSVDILLNEQAVNTAKKLESDKAEMDKIYAEYLVKKKQYENELNTILAEIEKIAQIDEEGAEYLIENEYADILDRTPEEPKNIIDYYFEPIKSDFIIELDDGTYNLEFVDDSGNVIEGSRKKLIVYSPVYKERVGYELLAIDNTKKRFYSMIPDSVIYINGKSDIIAIPFFENLYNDLYINKTLDAQAKGSKSSFHWHKTDQIVEGFIKLFDNNNNLIKQAITYSDYKIIRQYGKNTIYNLVPIQVNKSNQKAPDISGFALEFEGDKMRFSLEYEGNGVNPEQTIRNILIIDQSLSYLWFLLSAIPLVFGVVLVILRNKREENI